MVGVSKRLNARRADAGSRRDAAGLCFVLAGIIQIVTMFPTSHEDASNEGAKIIDVVA